MWKIVEKSALGKLTNTAYPAGHNSLWRGSSDRSPTCLNACSTCGGDYEDPERTAPVAEADEESNPDDDDTGGQPARDDFPVKRQ
jgi:hypothetical protein